MDLRASTSLPIWGDGCSRGTEEGASASRSAPVALRSLQSTQILQGTGSGRGAVRQPGLVAATVPPVEAAVEHRARLVVPAGAEQRGDPGLLDDLALGVASRRAATTCGPSSGQPVRGAPSSRPRPSACSARASGATTSRVGAVVGAARRPGGQPLQPGGVVERAAASTAACMRQERRRRARQAAVVDRASDLVDRRARRRRPGSAPSARAASRCPRAPGSPGRAPGAAGPRSGARTASRSPMDSSCRAACHEKWLRLSVAGAVAQ